MGVDSHEILRQEVAAHMAGADESSVEIVTAVAGLLAAIAYADRTITVSESAHLEAELSRINGIPQGGARALSELLRTHALRLSTAFVQRFTRTLRTELPEPHRAEVLDALLGMAAADGEITLQETTVLRNITGALGLTQAHYNELQEKHRHLLKH
jgi:uncharacterized tellurite resistance protein B-like protein